ncbi:conserved hypothetical protein [Beijerinckia indica subsp. indica ATCC 9039]|uniref:Uncharacterized protein n=1 Tax=Beijerinckia indica subsp. indica (strain ATCC 9039 / DSM 1715 / NCIMB 8712) TaxID=395963 RepID=B2IHU7_BEII9|nr:conserved hypothetical protein [Beijerinckia indica subsp. indica ATCC 9039]
MMEKTVTIIEHDFGKKDRDKVRRFSQLLSLEAQHEAKVLANPIPYIERATERISQLEMALLDAANAANFTLGEKPAAEPEQVLIDKAEYERLLRCKALIESAIKKL